VAYEKIADEVDSPLSTHSPPRRLSRNGIHASNCDSNDDLNINCHKTEQVNDNVVRHEGELLAEYCHLDVLKIALIVSPIWFIANCFYNYSLFMTSITSSTIISNLSGSFTLAFSYLSGVEEVTIPKVLGVVLCFIGAIVATLQDAESKSSFVGPSSFWGDLVALFAAIGYGVYTTVIRKKIPDDSGISMQLLLGYIGLVNFVLLLPVLIVFCVLNYGNIMAATSTILGFIILTGIIDNALSDYLVSMKYVPLLFFISFNSSYIYISCPSFHPLVGKSRCSYLSNGSDYRNVNYHPSSPYN
jgi:drug/metabolite transporter (DMT)-like permease